MSPTPDIPDPSIHGVITYDILSDDILVDPGYEIISMVITRGVNRIPVATIVLRDGNAADETFEISNTADFEPGKKIMIKLGRDGDNSQAFAGIITRHSIKVNESGQSDLIV